MFNGIKKLMYLRIAANKMNRDLGNSWHSDILDRLDFTEAFLIVWSRAKCGAVMR